MADHTWRKLVETIKDRLGTLRITPVSDEDLPDFIGEMNHVRALAQGIVTASKAEVDDRAVGTDYKMEPNGSYERSYNMQGIVTAVLSTDQFADYAAVLREMVDAGVLQIGTWTSLQSFLEAYDVPLVEVSHEITDGDPQGAMVGKVWKPKPPNVTAVTKEQA